MTPKRQKTKKEQDYERQRTVLREHKKYLVRQQRHDEARVTSEKIRLLDLQFEAGKAYDKKAKSLRNRKDHLKRTGNLVGAATADKVLKQLNKRAFIDEFVRNNMAFHFPPTPGRRLRLRRLREVRLLRDRRLPYRRHRRTR